MRALAAELWRLAWPAIMRNAINCASDRVTLAFVGHYDQERAHYDGAGLGKMYSNVTGLSVGYGICLGLATLCSQAYGAGRHTTANPVYFWRCATLLAMAFGFSAAAAFLCEWVLTSLAQPAHVAHCSAMYARVQLVGVPFFWVAQAIQTVCDSGLQDTRPGLYASLSAAMAQVALCGLFVHPALLNWGYLGMAAARSAGGVLQLGILCGVVVAQKRHAAIWCLPRGSDSGERVLACRGLGRYLRVALPGAMMMWAEWWSFEAFAIFVGMLPDAPTLLAAHGTMFNALVVAYMAFTGLNSALCATTGKHVGAGSAAHAAPRLVAIALGLAVCFAALLASGFYLLRGPLARAFTDDAPVIHAIEDNILGMVLSVPGYAVLMTLYGACQGANRQHAAFAGTAIGYLGGLPTAYYLGVVRHWPLPLLGVWLGNVGALSFAAFWIVCLVSCIDWRRVEAVAARAAATDDRADALLGEVVRAVEPDYACNTTTTQSSIVATSSVVALGNPPPSPPPSPPPHSRWLPQPHSPSVSAPPSVPSSLSMSPSITLPSIIVPAITSPPTSPPPTPPPPTPPPPTPPPTPPPPTSPPAPPPACPDDESSHHLELQDATGAEQPPPISAAALSALLGSAPLSAHHLSQWLAGGALVYVALGCQGAALPWMELDMRTRLGFAPITESLALCFGPLGTCVGAAVSGILADRYGRVCNLAAALLGSGVLHASLLLVAAHPALLPLTLFARNLCFGMPQGIAQTLLAELLPARRRGLLLNATHPFWQVGGVFLAGGLRWVTSSSRARSLTTGAGVVAANASEAESSASSSLPLARDGLELLGRPISFASLALLSAAPAVVVAVVIFVVVGESPLWLHRARGPVAGLSAAQKLISPWHRKLRRHRSALASHDAAATADGMPRADRDAPSSSNTAQWSPTMEAHVGGMAHETAPTPSQTRRRDMLFRDGRGVSVATCWFLLQFAFDGTDFFLIRYLHDTGRAGLMRPVTAVQYGFKIVGGLLGAALVDRVGRRWLLVPAFSVAAAATVAFTLADSSITLLLTATAMYYLAVEIVWGTLMTFTVELFPTAVRATAIGSAQAIGSLGSSITFFVNPLLMAYTAAAVPFWLNAAAMAAAALLVARLRAETAKSAMEA